jgi:DNA modification methylase
MSLQLFYKDYLIKELVATCKEKGITAYSGKKKAALIQLLLEKQKQEKQEKQEQEAVQEEEEKAVEKEEEQHYQYHVVNAFEYLEKDDKQYRCIYMDPPYASGRDYKFADQDKQAVFTDKFKPKDYHAWLDKLVTLCARRLTKDGTLWFHIAAEYSFVPEQILRAHFKEVEKIFWKKSHGKNTVKTKMGAVVDVLFRCYTAAKPVFHLQYVPLDAFYFENSYRNKDERGLYALGSLRFDKTRSGNNYDILHEGVTYSAPYGWKIKQANMEQLIRDNRIHFVSATETRAANLYKKLYKSENKGKPLSNLWDDISYITRTQKDPRTYPTQKPLKLLQRILEISTNPGDCVLDPTAGSGTTGVAAKSLGRHCCLLDINPDGRDIFLHRIAEEDDNVPVEEEAEAEDNDEDDDDDEDDDEPQKKKQRVKVI